MSNTAFHSMPKTSFDWGDLANDFTPVDTHLSECSDVPGCTQCNKVFPSEDYECLSHHRSDVPTRKYTTPENVNIKLFENPDGIFNLAFGQTIVEPPG